MQKAADGAALTGAVVVIQQNQIAHKHDNAKHRQKKSRHSFQRLFIHESAPFFLMI